MDLRALLTFVLVNDDGDEFARHETPMILCGDLDRYGGRVVTMKGTIGYRGSFTPWTAAMTLPNSPAAEGEVVVRGETQVRLPPTKVVQLAEGRTVKIWESPPLPPLPMPW